MHKSQSYSKQIYIFQISKLDNFAFVSSDHFKYKSCQRVPMKSILSWEEGVDKEDDDHAEQNWKKSFTQKQNLVVSPSRGFCFAIKDTKLDFKLGRSQTKKVAWQVFNKRQDINQKLDVLRKSCITSFAQKQLQRSSPPRRLHKCLNTVEQVGISNFVQIQP